MSMLFLYIPFPRWFPIAYGIKSVEIIFKQNFYILGPQEHFYKQKKYMPFMGKSFRADSNMN